MQTFNKSLLTGIALSSTLLLLSACGGGGGSSDSGSSADTGRPMVASDFTFPQVSTTNGNIDVTIPDGPVPEFTARRKLESGNGNLIQYGDPVVLQYTMFSWDTGEVVDSSDRFDDPVTLRAGVNSGAPEFVTKSLLGRNVGDRLQLVFPRGMSDLPSYLDKNDAYVVVMNLM